MSSWPRTSCPAPGPGHFRGGSQPRPMSISGRCLEAPGAFQLLALTASAFGSQRHHALDIAGNGVHLEIDGRAGVQVLECRDLDGVGNEVDADAAALRVIFDLIDRKAYAVDG